MENSDCTIVIASTDINEDLWEYLFSTIKTEWPECFWPILLITQTKEYNFPGLNIKRPLVKFTDESWSERVITSLKNIKSKYIIFLCDDYFFTGPVRQDAIQRCIEWMDVDSSIDVFYFKSFSQKGIESKEYFGYMTRPEKSAYRLNCQPAIWNREKFIGLLRPHEDPWQMEVLGSLRIASNKDKFYCLVDEKDAPIKCSRVGVLIQGKWVMSEILPLSGKYSWSIDFNKRGIYRNRNEPPQHGKFRFYLGFIKQALKVRITYQIVKRKSLK